ncbi:MAG: hypothetical protein HY842_00655 [Bacteroidetes bacterium]|nr:hypothetical protein [Bacteroidota bacterium]
MGATCFLFPVIAAGALLGVVITKYLSESLYRKFVIGMTLFTVVFLFF